MHPLVGASARDLIAAIAIESDSIDAFFVTSYEPSPNLEERITEDERVSEEFIREALRHRGYPKPPEAIPSKAIQGVMMNVPPLGKVRALCSRVMGSAQAIGHLPLLDFRCSVSDAASDAIVLAMRLLGEKEGALLVSGRSYHYYGRQPRALDAWREFMSRALLLAPLIDSRYTAHCLIENMSCLRFDARSGESSEPSVVREIC